MGEVEDYRRRSDDLLRLATKAIDLNERGRLISEAVRWHEKAQEVERGAAVAEADDATVIPFEPPAAEEQA